MLEELEADFSAEVDLDFALLKHELPRVETVFDVGQPGLEQVTKLGNALVDLALLNVLEMIHQTLPSELLGLCRCQVLILVDHHLMVMMTTCMLLSKCWSEHINRFLLTEVVLKLVKLSAHGIFAAAKLL